MLKQAWKWKYPPIEVGDVYPTNKGGSVTVVEIITPTKVIVEHNCPHKHRATVSASHMRKGVMKNPYIPSNYGVGYLGFGKYKLQGGLNSNVQCRNMWRNMLKRCYNESSIKKSPTYADVTVCEEWHNFQNFAEWYYKQEFTGDGYELDKDILVRGNKVYSPNSCAIIPRNINLLLFKKEHSRGNCMLGVDYRDDDYRTMRYISKVTKENKTVFLGAFSTEIEAHQAYVKAKEAYVKEVAERYRSMMDKEVYEALIYWRVNDEPI